MAEPTDPPTPPTPPAPVTDEDRKKTLHTWLDEWADAREKKNPPRRTTPDTGKHDIFSSLFGG